MTKGTKILRALDGAIVKARSAVKASAAEAQEASASVINLQRRQNGLYQEIAKERLELLADGKGGDLGYVDREAKKRLVQHERAIETLSADIQISEDKQDALTAQRETEAKATEAAVMAYNKASASAETKLRRTAKYQQQTASVEKLKAIANRANAKLAIARDDEREKGQPYRDDPFFAYLQRRGFGTDAPKGWFLTKWLDGFVARRTGYRKAAENYRRLTAIPVRLEAHLEDLIAQGQAEEERLHTIESDWLQSEGVSEKHKASILAQQALDKIDDRLKALEDKHAQMLAEQVKLIAGDIGPYRKAVELMGKALSRHNIKDLYRLSAQTQSREDDQAVAELSRVQNRVEDEIEDHTEAKRWHDRRRIILRDLQSVRQNFKARRYDSPTSQFDSAHTLSRVLNDVLNGSKSSSYLWKQIKRRQRTIPVYRDDDFGGGGWSSGSRRPARKSTPRRRSSSGGWGGGSSSRGSSSRSPSSRSSSGRSSSGGGFRTGGGMSSGRSGGGFRTGGGF